MKPIVATITIDRPRQELFDLICDLRNHEAWTDHMLVEWSGTPERVRVKSALPGPEDWLDIETTSLEPPAKTVERTTGAKGRRTSYGTYLLDEVSPTSTRVEFRLQMETMPRREKLLFPILRPWLKRGNDKAMRRLKEHAESR